MCGVSFWHLRRHQGDRGVTGAPVAPTMEPPRKQAPAAGMESTRAAGYSVPVDIKDMRVPIKEQPRQEPPQNCRLCGKRKQCTPVAFILARHLSTTEEWRFKELKFALVERYEIQLCADCQRRQYLLRLRSIFFPFLLLLGGVLALYWVALKLIRNGHYGYVAIPAIVMIFMLPMAGITLINGLRAVFLKSTTIEEATALLCGAEIQSRHNLSQLGTRFGIGEMQTDKPTEFILFTARDWKAKFNVG